MGASDGSSAGTVGSKVDTEMEGSRERDDEGFTEEEG